MFENYTTTFFLKRTGNWGFEPLSDANRLELRQADEADRLSIQLYEHLLHGICVEGRRVLEVGCGRGGGASYIMRYLKPKFVIGQDISNRSIAFCEQNHSVEGLSFVLGDAENLQFEDETFDVVVNVESSHLYPDMQRFLAEAYRVVKPHGYLLLADVRHRTLVDVLQRQVESSGFRIERHEPITSQVIAAIERGHETTVALIDERVVWYMRGIVKAFGPLKGSIFHRGLKSGNFVYLSYVLSKQAVAADDLLGKGNGVGAQGMELGLVI
jgi:ubiquinone/menaquinone biosynthesis C-methylase UbiE